MWGYWQIFFLCAGLSVVAAYLHYKGRERGLLRARILPLMVDVALIPLFVTLFLSKAHGFGQWVMGILLLSASLVVVGVAGFARNIQDVNRRFNESMTNVEFMELLYFTRRSPLTTTFSITVLPDGTVDFQPNFLGRSMKSKRLIISNLCAHCAIKQSLEHLVTEQIVRWRNYYDQLVKSGQQVQLTFTRDGEQLCSPVAKTRPFNTPPDLMAFCEDHRQ